MGKLIVPRHTADLDYILPAMQVYYDENGWVKTDVYKDRLVELLKLSGKEETRNTDETHYTKCSEIPRYFGFLERKEPGKAQSDVRITESGKLFYESIKNKDSQKTHEIIFNALENISFGRNNEGCGSDTDVEAPNVLVVSMILLNGISNKEAAYILGEVNDKGCDVVSAILKIEYFRKKGEKTPESTVTSDIKFIPFLKRIGFLDDYGGKLTIVSQNIIDRFGEKIPELPLTNHDGVRFTLSEEYSPKTVDSIHSNFYLPIALRTKPFLLLAGISGTGKSRIVRELAFKSCPKELQDAECTTPGNYCMIEVKPNWHDSTELLGYYSNISKRYVFTKFVKFLVKAMMYPDVPFFVCLDEMNLAPVEQYFAEFLSVLETRKKVGERIVSGALVDKQFFNDLANVGGSGYHNIKTNKEVYQKLWETTDSEGIDSEAAESDSLLMVGLTLPDNVFVIGTVNMDDTTHQFSRKVIDRAMTIEMNGGDLMEMFGGSAALSYMPEGEEWSIDLFRPRYVNADEVLKDHSECAEQIKKQSVEKLQDINTLLKGTPFEVSYRVLNELVIYLGNLLDEKDYSGNGGDGDDVFKNIVQEAFDAVTLMKILPRVEGDDEMFELRNDSQNRLQKLIEMFGAESGSGKKLQEMNDRLEKMQFTRFWP